MKKLLLLLCMLAILPVAAQKRTFKAACLNVDGLPPTVKVASVYNVKLNPDGPQADGTKLISQLVVNKGWDFFGVSENFNYNTELMSSLNGTYNCGTFRGKITDVGLDFNDYLKGKKWFNTDGLNLLWKSNITVTNEKWTMWDMRNGIIKDGADQLIAKGYRYYTVKLPAGDEIDVYILHMDAETTPKDNQAREVQMNQVVNDILASDNHRPILIMGDTNCRYTRDRIEEILFGRINNDPRFEIHDPWIDFIHYGMFPKVGEPSMMTWQDGPQRGEVVDKVFYINDKTSGVRMTAKNFLHDESFVKEDGTSVSDHFPIVIDFEIENFDWSSYTAPATPDLTPYKFRGEWYLRNVATGQYLRSGRSWGTHAVVGKEGDFGVRVTLTPYLKAAPDVIGYQFKSNLGFFMYNGGYLDSPTFDDRHRVWTVEETTEGSGIVTISSDGKAIGVVDRSTGEVNVDFLSYGNTNQQWVLVSEAELIADLANATSDHPKDATFLFRGNEFISNDADNLTWTWDGGYNAGVWVWGRDGEWDKDLLLYIHNKKKDTLDDSSDAILTINKRIGNLPSGRYKLSYQAATSTDFTFKANNKDIPITRINDVKSEADAITYFRDGNARHEVELKITNGVLELYAYKGENSSETASYFDNFKLEYLGSLDSALEGSWYIRNVKNGKYLRPGAAWGTHASVGDVAKLMEISSDGNGHFFIDSSVGRFASTGDGTEVMYMNKSKNTNFYWEIVNVPGNPYFAISYGNKSISAYDNSNNVDFEPSNPSDKYQLWELVSPGEMREDLMEAMPSSPKNATYLFLGHDFTPEDSDNDLWTFNNPGKTSKGYSGVDNNGDKDLALSLTNPDKGWALWKGEQTQWKITRTITGLPKGKYSLSFNGVAGNTGNVTMSVAGQTVNIANHSNSSFSAANAIDYFRKGQYKYTVNDIIVGDDGKIYLEGNKPGNTSATCAYFDNFELWYYGTNTVKSTDIRLEEEYNTLILPYDHAIPAGLKVYTVDEGSIVKRTDGYLVVSLTEVTDCIHANTPYIVKNTAMSPAKSPARVEARDASLSTFTFSGVHDYSEPEYTEGLLTGTHVGRNADSESFTFVSNSLGIGFCRVMDGGNPVVDPHRAYIAAGNLDSDVPAYVFFQGEDGKTTEVEEIIEALEQPVYVFSIDGTMVGTADTEAEALEGLAHGIYVVRQGTLAKKVLR